MMSCLVLYIKTFDDEKIDEMQKKRFLTWKVWVWNFLLFVGAWAHFFQVFLKLTFNSTHEFIKKNILTLSLDFIVILTRQTIDSISQNSAQKIQFLLRLKYDENEKKHKNPSSYISSSNEKGIKRKNEDDVEALTSFRVGSIADLKNYNKYFVCNAYKQMIDFK